MWNCVLLIFLLNYSPPFFSDPKGGLSSFIKARLGTVCFTCQSKKKKIKKKIDTSLLPLACLWILKIATGWWVGCGQWSAVSPAHTLYVQSSKENRGCLHLISEPHFHPFLPAPNHKEKTTSTLHILFSAWELLFHFSLGQLICYKVLHLTAR